VGSDSKLLRIIIIIIIIIITTCGLKNNKGTSGLYVSQDYFQAEYVLCHRQFKNFSHLKQTTGPAVT